MALSAKLELNSIRFCKLALLEKLGKYGLTSGAVYDQMKPFKERPLETVACFDFRSMRVLSIQGEGKSNSGVDSSD